MILLHAAWNVFCVVQTFFEGVVFGLAPEFNDDGTVWLLGFYFGVCPLQPKIIYVLEVGAVFVFKFIEHPFCSYERMLHCIEPGLSL